MILGNKRVITGIVAGVSSFVATGILTSVIRFIFDSTSLTPPLRIGGTFDLYAWAFYSAHSVGLTGPNNMVFGANDLIYDHVRFGLPAIVYLIVPPLVLFITGYLVVARSDRITNLLEVFTLIGVIGITYTILPFIGSFFIELAFVGGLLSSPDPGYTVLNMGVIYPIFFGGYGGLLAFHQ